MKKLLLTLAAVVGMLGAGSGNAWAETVNTTLYSWVGKSGGATQENGTIKEISVAYDSESKTVTGTSEITTDINASKNSMYVLTCNGSWAKLRDASAATTYFVITLNQPLATGDIISVTGYRTNTAAKYAAPAFVFNYGKENQYVLTNDDLNYNNINSSANASDTQVGSSPNTQTYTVPEEANGATSFILTRSVTGTNLFVTELKITGDRDSDAKAIATRPTISSPVFNFKTRNYTVTLTSTESGAVIHYSLNGNTEYTTYANPIEVSNGDKISYYASAENEDNSITEEYTVSGLTTYDSNKAYVAWAYQADYNYTLSSDPLYAALSTEYNVIPVAAASKSVAYTTIAPDLADADLVVITEAMSGDATFSNGLVALFNQVPIICMKAFNYGKQGDDTKRWKWGDPLNAAQSITSIKPADGNYKLFEGTTVENGEINLFDNPATDNHIQTVVLSGASAPANTTTLATVGDAISFHTASKYVLLGLSCNDIEHANKNAQTIIKNAAKLLLAEGNDASAAATPTDLGTASFTNMAYATFVSEKAAIIPEGVTAYIGALNDDNTYLNLTEVSGYIPANTPVLLEGTKGTPATLKSTIYTIADVEDNDLQGSTSDIAVPAGKDVYTLSIADDKVAFRKYTGSTLNAGKAYLALTAGASAPMIRFTGMDTDEPGNVTGINAVTIENNAQQVIYDLRGRRVLSLDRPGLYIVNGKKVAVQ
jgi:hypothetical protein